MHAFLVALSAVSVLGTGCATTDPRSLPPATTVPPKAEGSVKIRVASPPAGARDLGPIAATAEGTSGFAGAIKDFAAAAQAAGGNYAQIENIELGTVSHVGGTHGYASIDVQVTGRAFLVEAL